MGYIKCKISYRRTDEMGVPQEVRIRMLESDIAGTNMYELPILMHALATKGKVEMTSVFLLDKSHLDNELYILG